MAPSAELPEVELLPLEDGEGEDELEAFAGAAPRRGLLVAGVLAGTLVLLGVAGLTGRGHTPAAELAPSRRASITVAPTTTTAALERLQAMPTADGRGVYLSGERWSATVTVTPEASAVTSVATGRGFFVVTVAGQQARRFSEDGDPSSGTPVGSARVALPNPRDPAVVWLVEDVDGRDWVRTVSRGIAFATRARPVPSSWTVVGAGALGLILQRPGGGLEVWDPWLDAGVAMITPTGTFLAADRRAVAWWNAGTVVVDASPFGGRREATVAGELVAGAFSPDGQRLALLSREGAGWRIQVLGSAATADTGFVAEVAGPPSFGWTADGHVIVTPAGEIEYRYDPVSGLLARTDRRLAAAHDAGGG